MATANYNPELASSLHQFFRGRSNAYALKGRSGSWFVARDRRKADCALTDDVLRDHLDGRSTVGVYFFEPGTSRVRFAVLDVDDHARAFTWDQLADVARSLRDALRAQGLDPIVTRSSSGHGAHVCLFWDEPQKAVDVRAALRAARDAVDARGMSIEIYPKQDSVPTGGYGNLICLPFAAASCSLDERLHPCTAAQWHPKYSRPITGSPYR